MINGVVLAGGKSRRMNRDKRFLLAGEDTFLDRQVKVLSSVFDKVYISVGKEEKEIGPNQIEDVVSAGSLGGIFSSLKKLNTPVFVAAVDMPYITDKIIKRILSFYSVDFDVIIPEVKRRLEPLLAIYSPTCLPHMEKQINIGNYRIIDFFDKIKLRIIPQTNFVDIDGKLLFSKNINNFDSYTEYLKGE